MRSLPTLEHDEHVAEWIRLAEKSALVAPKSKSDANPKGAGRREDGTNRASKELGIERTDAQRATKVARLSDEAKEAAREAIP